MKKLKFSSEDKYSKTVPVQAASTCKICPGAGRSCIKTEHISSYLKFIFNQIQTGIIVGGTYQMSCLLRKVPGASLMQLWVLTVSSQAIKTALANRSEEVEDRVGHTLHSSNLNLTFAH